MTSTRAVVTAGRRGIPFAQGVAASTVIGWCGDANVHFGGSWISRNPSKDVLSSVMVCIQLHNNSNNSALIIFVISMNSYSADGTWRHDCTVALQGLILN